MVQHHRFREATSIFKTIQIPRLLKRSLLHDFLLRLAVIMTYTIFTNITDGLSNQWFWRFGPYELIILFNNYFFLILLFSYVHFDLRFFILIFLYITNIYLIYNKCARN